MNDLEQQQLQQKCSRLEREVLDRIGTLRDILDRCEKNVYDPDGILNDLGELQAAAPVFDCRVATLATLRLMQKQ